MGIEQTPLVEKINGKPRRGDLVQVYMYRGEIPGPIDWVIGTFHTQGKKSLTLSYVFQSTFFVHVPDALRKISSEMIESVDIVETKESMGRRLRDS